MSAALTRRSAVSPDVRVHRNTDARRRVDLAVADLVFLGQHEQQFLRRGCRVAGFAEVLEADDEFVAAPATDKVADAHVVLEPLGTSMSSASPMSWPSVSLTDLKRSRSINRAASGACPCAGCARWRARQAARGTGCDSRDRSVRRTARASSSRAVRCVCSVTSRNVMTPPIRSRLPSYRPWPLMLSTMSGCSGER